VLKSWKVFYYLADDELLDKNSSGLVFYSIAPISVKFSTGDPARETTVKVVGFG